METGSSSLSAEEQEAAELEVDRAMEALLDAERGSDCDDDDDNDDEVSASVMYYIRLVFIFLRRQDDDDDEEGGGSDFDLEGLRDDYQDSEEEEDSENDNNGDLEVESESDSERVTKKSSSVKKGDSVAAFLGLKRKASVETDSLVDTATSSTPSNFSQVDTTLSDAELKKKFPLFLEARNRSVTVTLKAGQMLYLPAGWFHEVRSRGEGSSGGHLAFNYWFHPPDNTDSERPYTSDFWAKDFEERVKSGNI
jgi:hypothetical protein